MILIFSLKGSIIITNSISGSKTFGKKMLSSKISDCQWLFGELDGLQCPDISWVDAAYPLNLLTLETDLWNWREAVGNEGRKVKNVGEKIKQVKKERTAEIRISGVIRGRLGNGNEHVQMWWKLKDTGANMERWDGASDWSLKKKLQRNQQGMDESEEESEEQIKKKEHYLPQCSVKTNLRVSLTVSRLLIRVMCFVCSTCTYLKNPSRKHGRFYKIQALQ